MTEHWALNTQPSLLLSLQPHVPPINSSKLYCSRNKNIYIRNKSQKLQPVFQRELFHVSWFFEIVNFIIFKWYIRTLDCEKWTHQRWSKNINCTKLHFYDDWPSDSLQSCLAQKKHLISIRSFNMKICILVVCRFVNVNILEQSSPYSRVNKTSAH